MSKKKPEAKPKDLKGQSKKKREWRDMKKGDDYFGDADEWSEDAYMEDMDLDWDESRY
ncbi:MAG: hypothetical protein GF416_07745 [Candidatus Altiarchaeales archaeon]|nr:hypothetical protein [Candidatus Altiarchaeales archaeon]MBD3417005.1 hypothetical protein [Candidatus Altiarchaeales archaeon]